MGSYRCTDVHFTDVKGFDTYVVCAKVEGHNKFFTKIGYYYRDQFSETDLVKQPVKKPKPVVKDVQKEVMKNASTSEVDKQDKVAPHVHHDMIIAWAKNPKLEMQFKPKSDKEWRGFQHGCHMLDWDAKWDYRFKPEEPKLLTIIGADGKARSYPEPCKVKPEIDSVYYATSPTNQPIRVTWLDDSADNVWFNLGIVHLTKEAAELHAKAMLGVD